MRGTARTALAALALGLVAAPFAGTSNAGCVQDFARSPYYTSNDLVTIDPDGIVTVNPGSVTGLVPQALDHVDTLVRCAV
jgi:hypothetical protein